MSKLLRVLVAAALLAGGVACKDHNNAPQSGATSSDSTVAGNTNSGTSSGNANPGAKPGDAGTSGTGPSASDSTTAQSGAGTPPGTAPDLPAMTAELQKCDALQGEKRTQCVEAAKKKSGKM